MNGHYYFDDATEQESYGGFYTFVIRDRRREGWIFRFGTLDRGHAGDVLRNLNFPKSLR